MAFRKLDLAWETSASSGTGAITLAGAYSNKFRTFAAAGMTNGDTCVIRIEHASASIAEWEVCYATWGTGGILTRGTLIASSTGSRVSFTSGSGGLIVYSPLLAQHAVSMDDNGDASVTRDLAIGRNATVAGTLGVSGVTTLKDPGDAALQFATSGGAYKASVSTSGAFGGVTTDALRFRSDVGEMVWGFSGAVYMTLIPEGLGVLMRPLAGSSAVAHINGDIVMHSSNRSVMGNVYYQSGWKYSANGTGAAVILGQTASIALLLVTAPNNSSGAGAAAAVGNAFYIPEGTPHWVPWNDGTQNLGDASHRYGTVYASTGAINTSDADDKTEARPLNDSEIALGLALAKRQRVFRFKDAVASKGDAARMHIGWQAQDVIAECAALGLNPFAYGFVGFDALERTETFTVMVPKAKTRPVPSVEKAVEIVDGVPVLKSKEVTRDEPVGTWSEVRDETGSVVMVDTGERDDKGAPITKPLLHFIAEYEDVPEPRARIVPDVDEKGEPRLRLNLRYDQVLTLVTAALMTMQAE